MYISNLRRALRDGSPVASPIVRQPPGYYLDVPAADAVDVTVFAAGCARAAAAVGRACWTEALTVADENVGAVARGSAERPGDRDCGHPGGGPCAGVAHRMSRPSDHGPTGAGTGTDGRVRGSRTALRPNRSPIAACGFTCWRNTGQAGASEALEICSWLCPAARRGPGSDAGGRASGTARPRSCVGTGTRGSGPAPRSGPAPARCPPRRCLRSRLRSRTPAGPC